MPDDAPTTSEIDYAARQLAATRMTGDVESWELTQTVLAGRGRAAARAVKARLDELAADIRAAARIVAAEPADDGGHAYLSTACSHALRDGTVPHQRCRLTCKYCGARCSCPHHQPDEPRPSAPERTVGWAVRRHSHQPVDTATDPVQSEQDAHAWAKDWVARFRRTADVVMRETIETVVATYGGSGEPGQGEASDGD